MTDDTDMQGGRRRGLPKGSLGLAFDKGDPLLLALLRPSSRRILDHGSRLSVIGLAAVCAGAAVGLVLSRPTSVEDVLATASLLVWAPLRLLAAKAFSAPAEVRAVRVAWAVSLLPFAAAVYPELAIAALVLSAVLFVRTLTPHSGRADALRTAAWAYGIQMAFSAVVWFGKSALVFVTYLLG